MRRCWVVVAVTALTAMSACSSDSRAFKAASPSVTPTVIDERAQALLDTGLAAIAEQSQSRYEFQSFIDGVPFLNIEGVVVHHEAWKATARANDPSSDATYVLRAVSVNGVVWMQMEGWKSPATGCWLALGSRQVPVGIQGLTPRDPGYLRLLGHLIYPALAESAAPLTFLTADLPLSAASALLQAPLFEHITLTSTQADRGTVRVGVTVDKGRLTKVELRGTDMLRAIEKAGGSVRSTSRSALESSKYQVSYLAPGEDVRVLPPDRDLVTTDLKRGCH